MCPGAAKKPEISAHKTCGFNCPASFHCQKGSPTILVLPRKRALIFWVLSQGPGRPGPRGLAGLGAGAVPWHPVSRRLLFPRVLPGLHPAGLRSGADSSANPSRQPRRPKAWGRQSGNPGRTQCLPPTPHSTLTPAQHAPLSPGLRVHSPAISFFLRPPGSPGPPLAGRSGRVLGPPSSVCFSQEHPSFLQPSPDPRAQFLLLSGLKAEPTAGGKVPAPRTPGCKLLV